MGTSKWISMVLVSSVLLLGVVSNVGAQGGEEFQPINVDNVGALQLLDVLSDVQFNSDFSAVVYSDWDTKDEFVWNLLTNQKANLTQTVDGLQGAAFWYPDYPNLLLGWNEEFDLRLIDVATLDEVDAGYAADRWGWWDIGFSADGSRMVTSDGMQIVVTDVATEAQILVTDAETIYTLLSADGHLLFWVDYQSGESHVVEVDSGAEVLTLEYVAGTYEFALSSDNRFLVRITEDAIHGWDLTTGAQILTDKQSVYVPQTGFVSEKLFVIRGEPTLVYDLETGERRAEFKRKDTWVSPDLSIIANSSRGKHLVWNLATDEQYTFEVDESYVPLWSDGEWAAFGYHGGSSVIHVYDLATGREVKTLPGQNSVTVALAVSADRALMASLDKNRDLVVWAFDGPDTGRALSFMEDQVPTYWDTNATTSYFTFSPDGSKLVLFMEKYSEDTLGRVWGVPDAEPGVMVAAKEDDSSAGDTVTGGSATAASDTAKAPAVPMPVELPVTGTFFGQLTASLELGGTRVCTVPKETPVHAVARGLDGSVLAYTAGESCEGAVWILPNQVQNMNWNGNIEKLMVVSEPSDARVEAAEPLETLPGFDTFCKELTQWGSAPGEPPYRVYAPILSRREWLKDEWVATSFGEVEVAICADYIPTVISSCAYTSGGQGVNYVKRVRIDLVVTLVNYPEGRIFAQQSFQGAFPPACPNQVSTLADIGGPVEPYSAATGWVLSKLSADGGAAVTTVNANSLNARAEPSTNAEILAQLPYGTHVNVFARNETGDWVVALTPEMAKVWLFRDLLALSGAVDFDTLPVVEGPAADVPLYVLP